MPSEEQDTLTTLFQFSQTLNEAIHDKRHELEPACGLRHFWDADNLAFPLWGFRAIPPDFNHLEQTEMLRFLVGTLFASGQLGGISLLPGHALEFQRMVGDKKSERATQSEIDEYLAQHSTQLKQVALALRPDQLHRPASEGRLPHLIDALSNLNPAAIILLEAIAATPRDRVSTWLEATPALLDSHSPEADLQELVYTRRFYEIRRTLDLMRSSPFSNMVDSTAFVQLAEMNTKGPPWPRFYTSTPTLIRFYKSYRWVRDLLSFEHNVEGRLVRGTIWRTAEYYYLRSMFACLHLRAASDVSVHGTLDSSSPSLDELCAVARQLDDYLGSGSSDASVVRVSFANGKPLGDFVEDFRHFGMAHVWLAYDIPYLSTRIRSHFGDLDKAVRDLQSSPEGRTILQKRWTELRERAAEMSELGLAVGVEDRLKSRASRIARPASDPDLLMQDDILCHRWVPIHDEGIAISLHRIAMGDSDVTLLPLFAGRELEDPIIQQTILGALYGLELYEDVEAVFVRLLPRPVLGLAQNLICLAAQIQSAVRHHRFEECLALMSSVATAWNSSSINDRDFVALGYAHAQLTAYRGYSQYKKMSHGSHESSAALGYLEKALVALQEQLSVGRVGDGVYYVHGVNLMAYAGAIAPRLLRIPSLAIRGRLTQLERAIAESPERIGRVYRFQDTMLYVRFRTLADEYGARTVSRDEACRAINDVHNEYLELARRTRDSEVTKNRDEVCEVLMALDCMDA